MGEQVVPDLEAFARIQELYISTHELGGGTDWIRDRWMGLTERFDQGVEAILSVVGSRVGNSEQLANCITNLGNSKLNAQISAGIKKAPPASALSGFGEVWMSVTGEDTKKVRGVVDEPEQNLARAIASDDIAGTGRLLGSSDVNMLRIKSSNFPAELLRKTEVSRLLDVAVGSGAVSVSRCLVEFHGAKPTRDTLKMALSSGKIELIELILERVPKSELDESRLDLLEAAISITGRLWRGCSAKRSR
jgi:hypothetical protein